MTPDIRIEGQGFYAIIGATEDGVRWLSENVPATDEGAAYSDDTRYTHAIAQGATEDGVAVAVNGYIYLDGGLRGEAA